MLVEVLLGIQCQTTTTSLGCLAATLFFLLWSSCRLLSLLRSAADFVLDVLETSTTGSASPPLPQSLPGPRGLPFVGYLPFIGSRPHVKLAELAKKFGGKAFRLAAGCRRYVVISRIETVRQLEKLYPQQLRGKPRTFTTEQMTLGAHNDLVQRWKRRRSYTDAGLKLIEGQSIGDTVTDEVHHLVDYLGQVAESSQPTDIRHDLALYSARTMYRVSYGREPDQPALDELSHLVDTMPDYTTMIGSLSWFDVLPFWRRLSPAKFTRFIDFNRRTAAFCRREKQRSMNETADVGRDSIGTVNSLFEFFRYKLHRTDKSEHDQVALTDDILFDGLEDIIRAGTESSSLVTKWFVLYLSAFPHVQRRMQREIDEYMEQKASSESHELTADDLPHLTYCRAVLAETCRYCCLNPFLKRELTADIILPAEDADGSEPVLLPRGTVILFNSWAVNNDRRHWSHPEEFHPERFLLSPTELDETCMQLYLPFGFGKRRCIGVDTGHIVCLLAATNIVQRFNVSLDGQPDFGSVFGIGLAPKPYRLKFEPRTRTPNNSPSEVQ